MCTSRGSERDQGGPAIVAVGELGSLEKETSQLASHGRGQSAPWTEARVRWSVEEDAAAAELRLWLSS